MPLCSHNHAESGSDKNLMERVGLTRGTGTKQSHLQNSAKQIKQTKSTDFIHKICAQDLK